MWSVYDRPQNLRANKRLRVLACFLEQKKKRKNHPFLWVVVEKLKKQEKITKNVNSTISKGEPTPAQKKNGVFQCQNPAI